MTHTQYPYPSAYKKLAKAIDDYIADETKPVKNKRGLRLALGVTKQQMSRWCTHEKGYGNETYGTDDDTSYRTLIEDAYDKICDQLLQEGSKSKFSTMFAMELNKSFGYKQADEEKQIHIELKLPEELKKFAK